jgi:hypothetical protein
MAPDATDVAEVLRSRHERLCEQSTNATSLEPVEKGLKASLSAPFPSADAMRRKMGTRR